jgi:hypothetical protein
MAPIISRIPQAFGFGRRIPPSDAAAPPATTITAYRSTSDIAPGATPFTVGGNSVDVLSMGRYNNEDYYILTFLTGLNSAPAANTQASAARYAVVSVNNSGTITTRVSPTTWFTGNAYDLQGSSSPNVTPTSAMGGSTFNTWEAITASYRVWGAYYKRVVTRWVTDATFSTITASNTTNSQWTTVTGGGGFCDNSCAPLAPFSETYARSVIASNYTDGTEFLTEYGTIGTATLNTIRLTGSSGAFTQSPVSPLSGTHRGSNGMSYNTLDDTYLLATSTNFYELNSTGSSIVSSANSNSYSAPSINLGIAYVGNGNYIMAHSNGAYNILDRDGTSVSSGTWSGSNTTEKVSIRSYLKSETSSAVMISGSANGVLRSAVYNIDNGTTVTKIIDDHNTYSSGSYNSSVIRTSSAIGASGVTAVVVGYDTNSGNIKVSSFA